MRACRMHRIGHQLPARDLLLAPDAGRIRIAHAHGHDRSGLADNQASPGALGIVPGHQFIWHPTGAGAAAGKRAHHQAVGQVQSTKLHRIKQGRHRLSVVGFSI